MIGSTIARYRITEKLGEGGMGVVYKARDTKLGRDVAIKVLPAAFAADSARMERFQREARTLASLNHPSIAAIYGIEESNGTHAIVIELAAGETLADRIARGPVPVEEAQKLALQIAEALEAAHEKGIVHRDLKPGNIMVSEEGQVKVLDFGLAKALHEDVDVADPEHSPTVTMGATQAGVILGTAGYMSPEQAKGKPVDRRADIWAFGVVLYEMLTGKRAFDGEGGADILAAIVKSDPDWSLLPAAVPSSVVRLLRRSLAKDARQRLQAIGDARIELQESDLAPAGDSIQARQPQSSRTRVWAYLLATLGLAVATFLAGRYSWSPATDPSPKRLALTLPDGVSLKTANGLAALALSPDGKRLVFVGEDTAGTQLYVRNMDDSKTAPLAGTWDAEQVTFSPDGRWIAFTASSQLRKLSLDGGSPITVSDHPIGDFGKLPGLSWGPDDRIVLGEWSGSMKWVPASGGTPEVLVQLESGMAILPQCLPDGGGILFTIGHGTSVRASIGLYSFRTDSYEVVVDKGYGARYLPTGHLLYSRGTDLFVAPFDPAEDEKAGAPLQLGERALVDPWGDVAFAVSPSGLFVYAPIEQDAANRLIWIDREGNVTPVTEMRRGFQFPRLSPSGSKIALTVAEGSRHAAHMFDLQRETLTALVSDRETDLPVWTPDGAEVAFNLTDGGPWHLFLQPASGGGDLEQITTAEIFHLPNSWSPDGKTLTFMTKHSGNPDNQGDIGMVDVTSQQGHQILIADPGLEMEARISPGGSHIAYDSDISGRREVWVRPFPGPGGAQQVSNNGGHDAVWSPDGGELFYRNGRKMMVVTIETEPQLRVGKPELLFEGPDLGGVKYYRSYDITPDGRRFIAVEQAPGPRHLSVVLNWFEELKRLVPK